MNALPSQWVQTQTGGSVENCKISTRPDGQPSAIADPSVADFVGRYSCGSHSSLSEFHMIHVPSELIPYPL